MSTLGNRILGTALGAAVGDALGCPFEFQPRSVVTARLGDPPWIDGLYPIEGIDVHPLGVWDAAAPCGIATDDTRMSWLMLHLVAEHGLSVRPKDLAQLYLAVYNRPQDFFPRHELLARDNLAYFVDAACGVLGQPSPAHPQASPEALTSGALGVGMPTLLGMISLPCAGCLQPGNHEEAYRRAFALAFMDVGYGRDVTAVMAAIVMAWTWVVRDRCPAQRRVKTMSPRETGRPSTVKMVTGYGTDPEGPGYQTVIDPLPVPFTTSSKLPSAAMSPVAPQ